MDRIKQQVDQLQQQLAGLTLSQKMLTATLVAIMVATVLWWGHYAATGERVPLLDQALTAEQSGGIQRVLAARGIEFDIRGDRIFVRGDRHSEAMGAVIHERQMPADTTDHFARAIGQLRSFDTRQRSDTVIRMALQDTMAANLRAMPGVRDASVILDQTYRRQMSGSILPKASVHLVTSGSANPQRLADAAANSVAGGVSGLELQNVTVTVDGRTMQISNPSDPLIGGSRYLQVQADAERHYSAKILNALAYIPGLTVSVSVEVNDTVSHRSAVTLDPENRVTPAFQDAVASNDLLGALGGIIEPGVIPNYSASLPGSDSGRSRQGEMASSYEYGKMREESYRGPGLARPTRCMLTVPMSWIQREWRARNGSGSEPEPNLLRQFEVEKIAEIQKAVSHALGQLQPDDVAVVVRADSGASFSDGEAAVAGVTDNESPAHISGLIRDFGREVAIVALAAVSLFLISTMVKKSAPLAAPAAPALDGQSLAMYGGSEVPFTGEGEGLAGQEMDEEVFYAGQMLEQVQTLVKENPDAAADLVKRWLAAV